MGKYYFTITVEEENEDMAQQVLDVAIKKMYKDKITVKKGLVLNKED